VIFTSTRTAGDHGYGSTAEEMLTLAARQPGFLGVDSARGADGLGITFSYWESEGAIREWKAVTEHQSAQSRGRAEWYADYEVRIARVERSYGFQRS
jgi:heme-degrading monooxygenase HmoA